MANILQITPYDEDIKRLNILIVSCLRWTLIIEVYIRKSGLPEKEDLQRSCEFWQEF